MFILNFKINLALSMTNYYVSWSIMLMTALLRLTFSCIDIIINSENTLQAYPVYREAQTGGLLFFRGCDYAL